MATYSYKVKGRNVELLEQDVFGYWVTPLTDLTDGLKFEYTYRGKFLDPNDDTEWDTTIDGALDESAKVDIPDALAKALVDYLKARFAEDVGEIEMKEYFMHQFQKMIDTHEENKTHGISQTMVGAWGIK